MKDESKNKQETARGSGAYVYCPECGAHVIHESGCITCPVCGWSVCG